VAIYPNPSDGIVQVISDELTDQIQVFDTFGKCCIHLKEIHSSTVSLDLTSLSTGVYYMRVKTLKGQHIQKQIIIN
jgi:hypothetical protein